MFNNSLDRRWRIIIETLLNVLVAFFVFRVPIELSFYRSLASRWDLNEHMTSRDNDILLYSLARCLAISPTKCHPQLRRAVRREAYENVIPSSQSPYRAIPANVVSHFSSSLRFSLGLFSGAVAYVFYEGMPPAWCTCIQKETENKR